MFNASHFFNFRQHQLGQHRITVTIYVLQILQQQFSALHRLDYQKARKASPFRMGMDSVIWDF